MSKLSTLFAINDHVRVKMTLKASSRMISPGEIGTVTKLSRFGSVVIYDLLFGDGSVVKKVSPIALEARK